MTTTFISKKATTWFPLAANNKLSLNDTQKTVIESGHSDLFNVRYHFNSSNQEAHM